MSVTTSYFMGANSPSGFFSLFEEIYNPYENVRPFIIKGGPGTGKSTLMKKIYEKAKAFDYDVELIKCSSDPVSLDAVIVPGIGISAIDGTSPHILEPKFPGAVENIINTGEFWNRKKLRENSDLIRRLTLENSICHRRASGYLSAAGALNNERIRLMSSFVREDKINSFALRFAMREAPKKKNSSQGRKKRRFLSAVTPEGIVFSDETVTALATRVIGIKDSVGAVSGVLCQRIGEYICRNGYDVIFCFCPFKPKDNCEHILIPELNLALLTVKKAHNSKTEYDRLIHAERFLLNEAQSYNKKLKWSEKLCTHITAESTALLTDAKGIHDELEKIYIGAMDFDRLDEYTDRLVEEIFDKQKA